MKIRKPISAKTKSVIKDEIKRQVIEQEDIFYRNVDAVILWVLHTEFKFGKTRLERFFKKMISNYKEMCKYYETDEAYPAVIKLREIGVDIEKLREENTR